MLVDKIEAVIREIFRGEKYNISLVKPSRSHPCRFSVIWLLNNDEERPNKESKVIKIDISKEAYSDLEACGDREQDHACERIRTFINNKLASHDPDYDLPRNIPAPEVEWTIASQNLGL